ncbi:hypothetical protein PN462_21015 [Spirulina sp. CS-785/01]|uniref:hypothetical protein n=1 Tax=Spirulina sp. CS-785/01 TaxID=3021716 RepID=UPI002330A8F6|nr:hypothetical protein [Spirulina sp. CS-785/01]MDB9315607.1 hypothetical protein [Spirulina sp. CS-785/01]
MPQKRPKQKDVNDFIKKGSTEPTETENRSTENSTTNVSLRIPTDLLQSIDALVAARRPSPSRHQWLLEALWEKVEREKDSE